MISVQIHKDCRTSLHPTSTPFFGHQHWPPWQRSSTSLLEHSDLSAHHCLTRLPPLITAARLYTTACAATVDTCRRRRRLKSRRSSCIGVPPLPIDSLRILTRNHSVCQISTRTCRERTAHSPLSFGSSQPRDTQHLSTLIPYSLRDRSPLHVLEAHSPELISTR